MGDGEGRTRVCSVCGLSCAFGRRDVKLGSSTLRASCVCADRGGEGARRFELLFERLADQVHDMAHRGAMAGETAGLDRWAQVWEQLVRTPREAEGLNLDRADAFWTMMAQLTDAARA